MKLENGLAVLELEPNVPNVGGTMYPTLLWDDEDAVLIDAGLPGQAETIMKLIRQEGLQPENVTKIIITHQDMDHIGSLAQLANYINNYRADSNSVEVLSHQIEKPYIEFEKMPVKFTKETLEKLKKQMSELEKGHQQQFEGMFTNNKPFITGTLSHEQRLSCCGGIKILHTPGHTPGHISIYLEKYKTLVAGDALNIYADKLAGADPSFTYDIGQARKSLEVFSEYDIQRVICYHGGVLSGDINSGLNKLI